MSPTAVLGVVLGLAIVVVPVWLALAVSNRKKKRGWMSRLASEKRYSYFPDRGDGLEFGIDPESGKPLREVALQQGLQLRYRDREFAAVEYSLGKGLGYRYYRPASSVQIEAPAEWTFSLAVRTRYRDVSPRLAELEQVKTFDRAFDERFLVHATDRERAGELFTPDLCARLLAEPRFQRWSVVAETGHLYTRQEDALLTREELFAQADFLLDLLALFPAEFWRAR
ncbi:MAG TPA: hypothetical protein VJX66_00895 [Amycolatopsis sp.]|nr:hypothetical protein [Amycolatopsis sp.]